MGARHPSLPSVRQEIKEVIKQLEAWAPNTTDGNGKDGERSKPLLQMNDRDLRELVIEIANKMEQLEDRVKKLEESQLN
jgi:hypothetical protein